MDIAQELFKQDLPLGELNGVRFKVKLSGTSAVEEVRTWSSSSAAHLVIVSEKEDMTWAEYREKSLGRGDLVSLGDRKMEEIVEHFLPGLPFEMSAWRFEVNSDKAASRDTVHTHIIVGHQNLFGSTGFIRRCVDSILKPRKLIEVILTKLNIWSPEMKNAIDKLYK